MRLSGPQGPNQPQCRYTRSLASPETLLTISQTTATVFTILLPILLLLVYVWGFFRRKTSREGAIALPEDERDGVVVVEEDPHPRV